MKFYTVISIVAVVITALTGCSETKDIKYYSLDSADYFAKVGEFGNNVLFVKNVSVPEYLDSKSFVFRGKRHEVFYTNENKWVEELSVLLNNSLLKNLRNRTDRWFVTNESSMKKQAELAVRINNFEINGSGTAIVDFDYKFDDGAGNAKIGTVHQEKSMNEDGYDAMVAALNGAWQSGIDEMVTRIEN